MRADGAIGGRDWRRRLARPLSLIVAVLLAAELIVRVRAGHLPSPQRWSAPEVQHKADQLVGWTARHGSPDVVVFGASMADDGLDPAVIDRSLGRDRAAYNASLVGTPIASVSLWATRFVVPKLRPRVVILGLSPVELNGNIPDEATANTAFRNAPAARQVLGDETFWQRATRLVGRFSALVRYRSVVRNPTAWVHGRRNGATGLASVSDPPLTSDGMDLTSLDAPYGTFLGQPVPVAVRRAQLAGDLFHDFAVDAANVSVVRQLVATLRSRGIGVVMVDLPLASEAVSYLPRGQSDVQSTALALQHIAGDYGVPFAPTGVWPNTLFADPVHLNGAGAGVLTSALMPTVSELLHGETVARVVPINP